MTTVTVYGTPNCVQCTQAIRTFERAGLELGRDFPYVDLSTTPAAQVYVTEELGYNQAPVVVLTEQDHWSGLRGGDSRRAMRVAPAARWNTPDHRRLSDTVIVCSVGEGLPHRSQWHQKG